MNKPYNIQNTNICNSIFHISFFKALLINEGNTTRDEREAGRNDPDSSVIIILMMFYFQSGQLGHSTNTIILKSSGHKSYVWVFGVIISLICTFQSSQFFDRLSMHFGVVDHFRASALTTADRRPPSWNRITDSTHALPFSIQSCRFCYATCCVA
jgi:hypothetical protein